MSTKPAPGIDAATIGHGSRQFAGNALLAALSRPEFERLRPDLKRVATQPREVLHRPGMPIDYVYFPHGGVFSVSTVMPNGEVIEAMTVGAEGLVGLEAYFTPRPVASGRNFLQVPGGDADRLSVAAFRRELDRHGRLYDLVGRYAQVALAVIMRTTGCNASHSVQQRCARWLLTAHDRMLQQRDFRLSHELLAMILGASRPTVSVAARALELAGIIQYKHGRIAVLDRTRLEEMSCSCYRFAREQFSRLGDLSR